MMASEAEELPFGRGEIGYYDELELDREGGKCLRAGRSH